MAQSILDRGVDINHSKTQGVTALTVMVHRTKNDMVTFLLSRGADPTIGYPLPLAAALNADNKKVVEILLGDPRVSVTTPGPRGAPLLHNVATEWPEFLEPFLNRPGTDINARDCLGWTPLMDASSLILFSNDNPAQLGSLRLLLANPRIDVNARSRSGETALFLAALIGLKTRVHMLLQHPDISTVIRDNKGRTAEMIAEIREHPDVVALLGRWNSKGH